MRMCGRVSLQGSILYITSILSGNLEGALVLITIIPFVLFVVFFFQVPKIAVVGSGGGFRAMVSLSGVFCALKDMGLLDCVMYTAGLSGSTW